MHHHMKLGIKAHDHALARLQMRARCMAHPLSIFLFYSLTCPSMPAYLPMHAHTFPFICPLLRLWPRAYWQRNERMANARLVAGHTCQRVATHGPCVVFAPSSIVIVTPVSRPQRTRRKVENGWVVGYFLPSKSPK